MKLEDQVVSLDLAKKLKELGVKQDSHFHWKRDESGDGPYLVASNTRYISTAGTILASAFTVAELGEMLPRILFRQKRTYELALGKKLRNDNEEWSCRYECESNGGYVQQVADTEADARAKMLIYLLENNLINPELVSSGETTTEE